MFSSLPSDLVCFISEFLTGEDICVLNQVSSTIHSDLQRVNKKRKDAYLNRPPTIVRELSIGIFEGVSYSMYENIPLSEWHDDKGRYHRVNGPAVIWANGDKEYYCHGKRHRVGGPAVILHYTDEDSSGFHSVRKQGDMFWIQNDKLYREEGPSIVLVVDTDGTRQYYMDTYCDGSLTKWKKKNKNKIQDMMYEISYGEFM